MQTPIAMSPARRSMLAAPVHCSVHMLLAPLVVPRKDSRTMQEAQQDLERITRDVEKLVQSDANIKQAFESLARWVSEPIKPEYLGLYMQAGKPDSSALKTFLSVTYARALWVLQNSRADSQFILADTTKILQNSAAVVQALKAAMDKMGPDFISHLITEAEIRTAEDPEFARVMAEAGEALSRLEPKGKSAAKGGTHSATRKTAGMIPLTRENMNEWWVIPSLVALASTIWQ